MKLLIWTDWCFWAAFLPMIYALPSTPAFKQFILCLCSVYHQETISRPLRLKQQPKSYPKKSLPFEMVFAADWAPNDWQPWVFPAIPHSTYQTPPMRGCWSWLNILTHNTWSFPNLSWLTSIKCHQLGRKEPTPYLPISYQVAVYMS